MRHFYYSIFAVVFSALVLFISIYRITALKYHFSLPNDSSMGHAVFASGVEYSLPYPGILPNNPAWPLKAMRDRLDLYFTSDPLEKAQHTLFLADKRLVAAQQLAQSGDYGRGVATAAKAEQYLEEALTRGKDADVKGKNAVGFFETLYKAALTHREVLEEMMANAPEDGKPVLNKTLDYSRNVKEQLEHLFNQRGKSVLTPARED
ncbi:MAG: hypothetical protein HYW33_00500 [Candidatus Blackburnbacteria bacterium]|nr:hypothetical protein [Candidatus Blackburnbacteria bacterium]